MSTIKVGDVEIHAAPGEMLVVNGVRVEILCGPGGKSVRPAQLRIAHEQRKVSHGREPDNAANQVIIDCLAEHGPMTAGRLLDQLGIDPKDDRRKLTGQRMSRMIAKGLLRRLKQDKHSGRPRYEVTPTD
jgi:hypothetical protein